MLVMVTGSVCVSECFIVSDTRVMPCDEPPTLVAVRFKARVMDTSIERGPNLVCLE